MEHMEKTLLAGVTMRCSAHHKDEALAPSPATFWGQGQCWGVRDSTGGSGLGWGHALRSRMGHNGSLVPVVGAVAPHIKVFEGN